MPLIRKIYEVSFYSGLSDNSISVFFFSMHQSIIDESIALHACAEDQITLKKYFRFEQHEKIIAQLFNSFTDMS